jgi:hypothetical protein
VRRKFKDSVSVAASEICHPWISRPQLELSKSASLTGCTVTDVANLTVSSSVCESLLQNPCNSTPTVCKPVKTSAKVVLHYKPKSTVQFRLLSLRCPVQVKNTVSFSSAVTPSAGVLYSDNTSMNQGNNIPAILSLSPIVGLTISCGRMPAGWCAPLRVDWSA